MKHLLLMITLLSGALMPIAAIADVRPHRLFVDIKAGSTPVCTPLAESLRFHFKSRQRMELSEAAQADHVISLTCDPTKVDAVWTTRLIEGGKKTEAIAASVRLAITGDPMKSHPSLALALTQQLLEKVPWDGEINALIKPRKVDGKSELIGPPGKSAIHTMANAAAGYIQSVSATNCSPFEIAALKKGAEGVELEVFGAGAFTSVGTFASPSEVYLDHKVPSGVRPVFRLILVADARRAVRQLVARCKKTIGEGEGESLSRLVAGDLGKSLSKETIEINMVQQRAGIFLGRFSATNGVKVPFLALAYAQSRADIGDFLAVDGRLARSASTRPYQGSEGSEVPNPEITFGEGFVLGRFSWDDLSVTAGPGLILEKINTPYFDANQPRSNEAEDGTSVPDKPKLRSSNFKGAFALGIRTDFNGWIADSQTAFSLGSGDRHLTFETGLNYKLTDTWFVGGDVFFVGLGQDSKGGPGGNLVAIGGHMGFVLKRTKKEASRR